MGEGQEQGRDRMEYDVVIVGAGPAGLAAAIRLKQLNPACSVVILEKGAAVGAHILSGAVIDPSGLDELLPGWRDDAPASMTKVTGEHFLVLSKRRAFRLPNFLMPPLMNNHGNYVASLGDVCRWLGEKAEALGVEIYPGFAATEVLYDSAGAVIGVATGDTGIGRDGQPRPGFARGMELVGRYTLFGEGARGSLTKTLLAKFGLAGDRAVPKFGIGIKETWEINPALHRPGFVQHSFGWPLDARTGGGSFLYHLPQNRVAVGFVVHLDYANPFISPFEELQRFKTHPSIAPLFKDARRTGYGARAITEGGWQSVPKLVFPGGALLGCAAGMVNVPRIKGVHNAMRSGMQAAGHVAAALQSGRSHDELTGYEDEWRWSPIGRDLRMVRNVKPLWARFGTFAGIALASIDLWFNTLTGGWSPFGTLLHRKADHKALDPANLHSPIDYPKPDGVLTFDRLSSVYLSNTNHEEDQPSHLRVANLALQVVSELGAYAGPSARYCPAAVYEWQEKNGAPDYVVNFQNCVHCKTCDIKDPNQNITWVPPQGGDGPVYPQL
ncbi:electron transfer flavoprotein-ubiquinone oxidoreductase [Terrihabitans soli]|uniref:Electron transfer flavoprotein-ubiquinone oxidoreductase n=1 Tax=Terrihabitans soli TaxID=708113 RepID=A0A6S6QW42_9HYPH|nr:electron transfer flavoprotein-ubiquinone oxidoreductase [Terrihabitans soli]BCJ91250.1 electron transfer flavoprotein-ubiquinone oxidoreductase [Terrihabitans soli]